jgi:PAS domain S-box-containing protein
MPELTYSDLLLLNQNLEKRIKTLEEKVIRLKSSEDTFREYETRFRQLADSSLEGIVIHDNCSILEVNAQIGKMLNCPENLLKGQNILDFIDIEHRRNAMKNLRGEDLSPCDVLMYGTDGSSFEVEMRTSPFSFEGREVKVSVFRDLSHQKLFERTIEESDIVYRQMAENSTDAIIIQNDYAILYWNMAFERIFGVKGVDIRNQTNFLANFVHQDDRDVFLKMTTSEKFLRERRFEAEYRIVKPDGKIVWVWNRCFPVFNKQGDLLRQIMMISDITLRRKAEERERHYNKNLLFLSETALRFLTYSRESDIFRFIGDKLTELTENAIVIVLAYNSENQTLAIKHTAGIRFLWTDVLSILKIDPENIQLRISSRILKVLINRGDFLYPVSGGLYEASLGQISREQCYKLEAALKIHKFWSMGLMHSGNLYGEVLIGSNSSQNLKEQKIIETFLYQASISLHRKQLELELVRAKEKAEESDRLKSAFLANMSHEIRTPMNGILGLSQLLAAPDISEIQRKEFLGLIDRNSESLLHLIDDIIDISKIEAGQMKIFRCSFRLNNLLEQVRAVFYSNPVLASKPNIKLVFTKPLPDTLCIYSAPDRLRQVIINLTGNALKFTNNGKIEIGYELKGSLLEFYVRDSGIGIPPEKQRTIFNRFTQADSSLTRKYGGAGLGLAISKGLIELLGGQIWVYSEPGKGSVFHFNIPYIPSFDDEPVLMEEPTPANDKKLEGKTILLVEDDLVSFKFMETILKKAEAQVLHADNGIDAVEMCKTDPKIDLVLMDVQLPGISGLDATLQIISVRRDLPIIAQTANAMSDDKERCLEAGCVDYLSKPINVNVLFKKISKYLS